MSILSSFLPKKYARGLLGLAGGCLLSPPPDKSEPTHKSKQNTSQLYKIPILSNSNMQYIQINTVYIIHYAQLKYLDIIKGCYNLKYSYVTDIYCQLRFIFYFDLVVARCGYFIPQANS